MSLTCIHCDGRIGRPFHDALRHLDKGDSVNCHDGTNRTATFCATCWDDGFIEDGQAHLPACPDCVPRCIGRNQDGCGFQGLYGGATCPDCGGMILDGEGLAEAAELAERLMQNANRGPVL